MDGSRVSMTVELSGTTTTFLCVCVCGWYFLSGQAEGRLTLDECVWFITITVRTFLSIFHTAGRGMFIHIYTLLMMLHFFIYFYLCTVELWPIPFSPSDKKKHSLKLCVQTWLNLSDHHELHTWPPPPITVMNSLVKSWSSGHPPPEVVWFHDEQEVMESEDFHLLQEENCFTLLILEVFPEDTGTYSCRAWNQYGEAKTEAQLTVEGNCRRFSPTLKCRKPILIWEQLVCYLSSCNCK